jgi:hypothetical protein
MDNELDKFLNEKQVADPIRSAFIAYCKSLYSSRYKFKSNGDTVKMFLENISEDQINSTWNEFLSDLRNILPTISR